MGLTGKLIGQIEIKAVGDLFHQSFRHQPHSLSDMSPDKVHGFELHEGAVGTVGSRICWHYTHDGKRRIAKQIIEDINEETKSIKFKMIEGDLMELYKSFIITYDVDDTGDDKHLVTWTLEYEKLNENVADPTTLMQFFLDLTREMANHCAATQRPSVQ